MGSVWVMEEKQGVKCTKPEAGPCQRMVYGEWEICFALVPSLNRSMGEGNKAENKTKQKTTKPNQNRSIFKSGIYSIIKRTQLDTHHHFNFCLYSDKDLGAGGLFGKHPRKQE